MTAANPLFDFMPYGAPELIAAQRSHQSRALALASGAALVTFVLAYALGLRLGEPAPVEVRIQDRATTLDRVPHRQIPIAEPPAARPNVPVQPDVRAIPVPVPEINAPPPQVIDDPGRADGVVGIGHDAHAESKGQSPILVEDLPPERGDIVAVDVMPVVITSVKPNYPELAKDVGVEGRVFVHMLVGKNGRVMRAEVNQKFSVPMLDASALDAARQFVFTPALRNDHPVMVWVGQMFVFKIR